MDLWIRSQDKSALVKVKSVLMLNKEIRGYYNENPNWLLGKYDTEERALEVLDEIKNYKDKLEKAWFWGMTEAEFVSSTYEMPKE